MFKMANFVLTDSNANSRDYKQRSWGFWCAGIIAWLMERVVLWSAAIAIARERSILRKLTDSELADIGISRAQADEEARREFFDIPGERLTMNGLLDCGEE